MIKAILKWQYKRYCKKGYDRNLVPYSFDRWLLYSYDESYYFGEPIEIERIEEWEENLAECKRQRDAYYDELTRLRQEKVELIDKACDWLKASNGKRFNGFEIVYTQGFIKAFRTAMEESAMTDEEYLNSKIEAYGKAHPNGNKEDLELLAEMRGYDKEDEL